ncbi:hypothetical protein [Rickettsia endosymbiont of Ceutorhynchus obstrictus]|uniref:hypothetical protein n=1 Tax=Rickettsia endosymbiont of Ceutorhynchus obstrictus TaxID=3066249 RepID=UPI00313349AF
MAWLDKSSSMSFLQKQESRKIIFILNLFQDISQEMLKQVQHDKRKSGFLPLARMTSKI